MIGPSKMRIGRPAGLVMLVVGSLAGCGDGTMDDGLVQTTSAVSDPGLTTGKFTLHNYQTGLCLGVAAGTPTRGTPLVVWTCDQSANQNWQQLTGASFVGWIELQNFVADDRCMNDIGNVLSSDGTKIGIDKCYDTDYGGVILNDSFQAHYVGNDLNGNECYNFVDQNALAVGVSGGKTGNGQPIILWSNFHDPYNHPDQIWCVYPPSAT
jgi:hypothetical protein